jgi:hypothetical protein
MSYIKNLAILCGLCIWNYGAANAQTPDSSTVFKKRVLESAEIDFLTSIYGQDGKNAAVSGGKGTEQLLNGTGAIVISVPLNADDVLTIDASVSAYSSASSSNINPFDRETGLADPFVASSGASRNDVWSNYTASFSHNSDDRNKIWSAKASVSTEFDYTSIGIGGDFARLFNQKNTELSIHFSAYFDEWKLLYPVELRGPESSSDDEEEEDDEDEHFDINNYTITGNPNYSPSFAPFQSKGRYSYTLGFGFAQILSKTLQGSISIDIVKQIGLLSTPFQRVYFSDVADSFIENFHLADDVERLPGARTKLAAGARLNYYLNEIFILRTFYRYYTDDWGILSHTSSIELPIKVSPSFTLYPSYRFYIQTASTYFKPYNQHLSSSPFYTSDFDLSEYFANQYSLGISYSDIFTSNRIWRFGMKSIDLKLTYYNRNSSFQSFIITAGTKFIFE